jgi:hypothetical protein
MSAYNDLILLDSPLLFYALDDKPPTGGRTALGAGVVEDFSGNASHGSEYGAAAYDSDGVVGDGEPCDLFSATRIDGPGSPHYDNGIDMSVEFWWVPTDATPGINKALVNNGWATNDQLFLIRQSTNGNLTALWQDSSNNNQQMDSGVLTDGETYHVVYTVDTSSGRKLYINGSEVDSTTDTHVKTVTTRDLFISGFRDPNFNSSTAANGSIDKVALYTTVLTPTQVSDHYNWQSAGNGGGGSGAKALIARRRGRGGGANKGRSGGGRQANRAIARWDRRRRRI